MLGLYVPTPPDHIPVVEAPVTVPLIATVALFAQTEISEPEVTTGGLVNFKIKLSILLGQPFKLPVEVKLKVTLLPDKSLGEGM